MGTSSLGKILAAVTVLALTGCAREPPMIWQRFDGKSVFSSPALAQQAEVDFSTCRAVALNAGTQVQMPSPAPRISVQNNINVPVYVGPGPSVLPPAPGSYSSPQVDFSGLADAGAAIAANNRRSELEGANMSACMTQRGYRLVPAPQPKAP